MICSIYSPCQVIGCEDSTLFAIVGIPAVHVEILQFVVDSDHNDNDRWIHWLLLNFEPDVIMM